MDSPNYQEVSSEIVFVVESCQNCKEHGWNTRHDEGKYSEFFKRAAAAIIDTIPNAMIMKNQIPKSYLPFDLYNNLVPNEDENTPYYQQVPRTGAFEVSYKGMLVFSKLKGGYWPNCDLVAEKCKLVYSDERAGKDCAQYLAGYSPSKDGGFDNSSIRRGPERSEGATSQKTYDNIQAIVPSEFNIKQEYTQPKQFNLNQTSGQQLSAQQVSQQQMSQQQMQFAPQFDLEENAPLKVNEQNSPPSAALLQTEPAGAKFQGPDIQCGVNGNLRSSDALTGFPVFPPGTKSLLSKNLTRDLWQQQAGTKDSYGFRFENAIFSGCSNVNSVIGVYAGSIDSYKRFDGLFDKIIEQYHGHGINDIHQAENPNVQLNAPDFTKDEAAMIRSTRIRVGRNLASYPLGPHMSDQDRSEVEEKILEALSELKGDIEGDYYPLSSMNESEKQKLQAEHVLITQGQHYLDNAAFNSGWPQNRGVYYNPSKTFVAWINGEDQLRIISMQNGSNIREVFQRLTSALSQFENSIKFSQDDHLGYITACPTNLGTAMRASVHIHLPLLEQRKNEIEGIADKFSVQVRHLNTGQRSDDGVFDISNRRRLGRSMTLLVQDMYDGVRALIKREKELQRAGGPVNVASNIKVIQAGLHLKQASDITGMVEFPMDCKSLLCKYLTPEIQQSYLGQQDSSGISFEQIILPGCQNVDSTIGVYAGSHQSYIQFAELMDPIIEDYHLHGKKAKHMSNMNHDQLNCPVLTCDDADLVLSCRIRVNRNFADYPLGPALTKIQRDKVEEICSEVFATFTGELEGTYFNLNRITKAEQELLNEDNFLFGQGDRFLESAGFNRQWPSGRGIFHNIEKTLLIWVNQENQLNITSMQQGPDIKGVFQRLAAATAEIEKVAKYAKDDHLGYITACPTNCGTSLKASVHLKLIHLAKKENRSRLNSVIQKYKLSCQDLNDSVFDISNTIVLGKSEVDLVQDIYDAMVALIEAEKSLMPSRMPKVPVPVIAGPQLRKPSDITGVVTFPPGTKSLLAKFLTPEVYEKYAHKTDSAGCSFEKIILSGCQNLDSTIGVYAGCHDSYYRFPDIFEKVVCNYHKYTKGAKHVSNMDFRQLKCPPLKSEDANMIVSTRIRIGRNLADFPLGPHISRDQRDQVEKLVSGVLKEMTGELEGKYYEMGLLSDKEKAALAEEGFLFKEGDKFQSAAGLNRDWPAGRGIFHNHDKSFLVWINKEDHLRIISMQKGADILSVFRRLCLASAEIERTTEFAHDDHLGYVTACPSNLGTGLRASVHINLQLLGKKDAIEVIESIESKYFIDVHCIQEPEEEDSREPYVFDVSNRRRLGRSEVDLVQDMYDGVKALLDSERRLKIGQTVEDILGLTCEAGPALETAENITGRVKFPSGCRSCLSKALTKDVYKIYKGKKDACGVTFEQTILTGSQQLDAPIGVYAGCHDAYSTFNHLFDPIIEQFHDYKKDAKHKTDLNYSLPNLAPLKEGDASMILSTRMRTVRNFSAYPLGPGLSKDQRDEIEKTVSEHLKELTGDFEGHYYKVGDLNEEQFHILSNEHFLLKPGDRFQETGGLNRDFPTGRGIFHNNAKTFLVWINEEDHLKIVSMQKGSDFQAVFKRLAIGAEKIEKVGQYVHDHHLGYVSTCPSNLGTGLRVSCNMKLPFLGHMDNKARFLEIAQKHNIQVRRVIASDPEKDEGGVFDVSNIQRLGRSEANLIQDLYDGVRDLIKAEKDLGGGPKMVAAPKEEEEKASPPQKEEAKGEEEVPQPVPEVAAKEEDSKNEQQIFSGQQEVQEETK